ncbi:hypothetical protein HMI56_000127 [Coelomomyces lativittatus]|nr:hypothetical protein HMI56_000127 [Coelomomyces lativittatus]
MHLTCTHMSQEKLDMALMKAQEIGIQTILALRGDPVAEKQPSSLKEAEACKEKKEDRFYHAIDLLFYIQKKYPTNTFCLGVAGYPEGHPDTLDPNLDIQYLLEKVHVGGAEYVVTQLFYDVPGFLRWYNTCRERGLQCPVLPGIMPITTYEGFQRMTTLCKTHVPDFIQTTLHHLLQSERVHAVTSNSILEFGIHLAVTMVLDLFKAGIHGFHFYTMNQSESTMTILKKLKWILSPSPTLEKVSLHPKHTSCSLQKWPIYFENKRWMYVPQLCSAWTTTSFKSATDKVHVKATETQTTQVYTQRVPKTPPSSFCLLPSCLTKDDVIEYYVASLESHSDSPHPLPSQWTQTYFPWGRFEVLLPFFTNLTRRGIFVTNYVSWFPYFEFIAPYSMMTSSFIPFLNASLFQIAIVPSPFFSFSSSFYPNHFTNERHVRQCYTNSSGLLKWTNQCFQLFHYLNPTNPFLHTELLPSYVLVSITTTTTPPESTMNLVSSSSSTTNLSTFAPTLKDMALFPFHALPLIGEILVGDQLSAVGVE